MHRFLTLFNVLILLGLTGLIGCRKEAPPRVIAPIAVTAWTVEPVDLPVVWNYMGFVESSHEVQIQPRVEGYLQTIAYTEGAVVEKDSLLFQIDPTQFKTAVARAEGTVARQKALLANANLTVERLQPLYEQKAASRKDLDNALSQKLSAQASLQSAEATLLNAQINLGYTTITSPVKGLADKARVREGSLITPGPNALLTTISTINPIWVYFTVSDNDILHVKNEVNSGRLQLPKDEKYQVEVVLSDGSVFPYHGQVDFNSPTYNRSTGTMLIRALFPNPSNRGKSLSALHPGQFVRVHVLGAYRPHALCIPKRALVQKKDGMFVYLIHPDGTVTAQDVEAGEWEGEMQCIHHGLKPGDRIVVDGTNKIVPQAYVEVIKEWQPPALEKAPIVPTPSTDE